MTQEKLNLKDDLKFEYQNLMNKTSKDIMDLETGLKLSPKKIEKPFDQLPLQKLKNYSEAYQEEIARLNLIIVGLKRNLNMIEEQIQIKSS